MGEGGKDSCIEQGRDRVLQRGGTRKSLGVVQRWEIVLHGRWAGKPCMGEGWGKVLHRRGSGVGDRLGGYLDGKEPCMGVRECGKELHRAGMGESLAETRDEKGSCTEEG